MSWKKMNNKYSIEDFFMGQHRDLDVWFSSLDLEALARMFSWPAGHDANDFIDDCDEYWWNLSPEEKEDFFYRHS